MESNDGRTPGAEDFDPTNTSSLDSDSHTPQGSEGNTAADVENERDPIETPQSWDNYLKGLKEKALSEFTHHEKVASHVKNLPDIIKQLKNPNQIRRSIPLIVTALVTASESHLIPEISPATKALLWKLAKRARWLSPPQARLAALLLGEIITPVLERKGVDALAYIKNRLGEIGTEDAEELEKIIDEESEGIEPDPPVSPPTGGATSGGGPGGGGSPPGTGPGPGGVSGGGGTGPDGGGGSGPGGSPPGGGNEGGGTGPDGSPPGGGGIEGGGVGAETPPPGEPPTGPETPTPAERPRRFGDWRDEFFMEETQVSRREVVTEETKLERTHNEVIAREVYRDLRGEDPPNDVDSVYNKLLTPSEREEVKRRIKQLALETLSREQYNGAPIVPVPGKSIYKVKFDLLDFYDCKFGAGENSQSIIAQITRAGIKRTYSIEELIILRSLETRQFEPDKHTLFEELVMHKLGERIKRHTDQGGTLPLTKEQKAAMMNKIYEEFTSELYTLQIMLNAATKGPDEEGKSSGGLEAELYQSIKQGMKYVQAKLKRYNFSDYRLQDEYQDVYAAGFGQDDFTVTISGTIGTRNARQLEAAFGPSRRSTPDARGAIAYVHYDETKLADAFKLDVIGVAESIESVTGKLNKARDVVHDSNSSIDAVLSTMETMDVGETNIALRQNPMLKYAVQIMPNNFLRSINESGRNVDDLFGTMNPRIGLSRAEDYTLHDLLAHPEYGHPPDILSNEKKADEVTKETRKIFKRLRDEKLKEKESGFTKEQREQGVKPQLTDDEHNTIMQLARRQAEQEVNINETAKWNRHKVRLKTTVMQAFGYHIAFTGEIWSIALDAIEQTLTSYGWDDDQAKLDEIDAHFAKAKSGFAKKILEMTKLEAEQKIQRRGNGVRGIPVPIISEDGTMEDYDHADFMRFARSMSVASKAGAEDEVLDVMENHYFLRDILKKAAGDILRIGSWRTHQIDLVFIAQYEEIAAQEYTKGSQEYYQVVLNRLFRFGGGRVVAKYIESNVKGMMLVDPQFQAVVTELGEAKKEYEKSRRERGGGGIGPKRRYVNAREQYKRIKYQALTKYLDVYMYNQLLARDPSMALRIEQRSLTPKAEATVRQSMIDHLDRDEAFDQDAKKQRVLIEVVMPAMEMASQHIARMYHTEVFLGQGKDKDGKVIPQPDENGRIPQAYDRMEHFNIADKAQAIYDHTMDSRSRDLSPEGTRAELKKMFKEWMKHRGRIENPASEDGQIEAYYVNFEDILSQAYKGEKPEDVLLRLFERFHPQLIKEVSKERHTRSDPNSPTETLSHRFAFRLARGQGAFDASLTSEWFNYSSVEFQQANPTMPESVFGLKQAKRLKELENDIFGPNGHLYSIYAKKTKITPENVEQIVGEAANAIKEMSELLTSNPLKQDEIQARLVVLAVATIKKDNPDTIMEALRKNAGAGALTIWDELSGPDGATAGTLADREERYLLLRAFAKKLRLDIDEEVGILESKETIEDLPFAWQRALARAEEPISRIPVVGKTLASIWGASTYLGTRRKTREAKFNDTHLGSVLKPMKFSKIWEMFKSRGKSFLASSGQALVQLVKMVIQRK